MRKIRIILWPLLGAFVWAGFGVLATAWMFEPSLDKVPLASSWTAFVRAAVGGALIGCAVGALAFRVCSVNSEEFSDPDQADVATTMFVAFWGTILAVAAGIWAFPHLSIDGASLRSIFVRCLIAGVAGFLASLLLLILAERIEPKRSTAQLSDNGVLALLMQLPQIHTETLQFFESTTRIMPGQEVFIPNVLAEFRDPSVAVVYGSGVGHVYVRVSAVRSVASALSSYGFTWHGLVAALESKGYKIKRIGYFATMSRLADQPHR